MSDDETGMPELDTAAAGHRPVEADDPRRPRLQHGRARPAHRHRRMTLAAAATEVVRVVQVQEINLADILLMFLYTEVVGMIGVFYTGKGSAFVYPIFIAITALARLIVLQGKNMAPENIVFEASAILLLALAAAIIVRLGRHQ